MYNQYVILITILITSLVYLFTLSNTVFGGDAGDLISAIITYGFAHPPGYPLYTLLGIFLNQLPINLSPAGKVTLISIFSYQASFLLLFLILKEIFNKNFRPFLALVALFTLAFNYLIWLYAIVPEVFPLNILISFSLWYFGLKFLKTEKVFYLYLIAFFIGLGLSHHHTFLLILPSIFILIGHKFRKIKSKKIYRLSFLWPILGYLPLFYIYFSGRNLPEIIWGDTSTFLGFFQILSRAGYGSFVPGPFITNLAPHRLIQLINLFFFIQNDFTYAGLFFIALGLFSFLTRKNKIPRKIFFSLLLALFFTGPFFFFYGNFPLKDAFDFATIERFFILFYFILTIPLYQGIVVFVNFLKRLIKKNIASKNLTRLFSFLILIELLILPIGLFIKNYPVIYSLKNDKTAENLGIDILSNAEKNSLILLAADTTLFNTQYIYFASGENLKKEKIVIHTSKIPSPYYQEMLKKHYPKITFAKGKTLTIPEFIKSNLKNFHIFSNDKYPIGNLPDYQWIPQGLLFKLVKKDIVTDETNLQKLKNFWQQSKNKQLVNQVKKNPKKFRNNFLADILRIYATAHQNTAYFLLKNNFINQAYPHIVDAKTLNPKDRDVFYLFSLYYQKKGQCFKAEKSIEQALTIVPEPLYLDQLKQIGEKCYRKIEDKKRIEKKLDAYQKSNQTRLTDF